MMKALKDYGEMVWKPSWKWVVKHWKGYSVLLVVLMVIPYIWLYWDDIKGYIRRRF